MIYSLSLFFNSLLGCCFSSTEYLLLPVSTLPIMNINVSTLPIDGIVVTGNYFFYIYDVMPKGHLSSFCEEGLLASVIALVSQKPLVCYAEGVHVTPKAYRGGGLDLLLIIYTMGLYKLLKWANLSQKVCFKLTLYKSGTKCYLFNLNLLKRLYLDFSLLGLCNSLKYSCNG